MKSRSPYTRIARSPYAASARAGPLIAIAGTPVAAKESTISAAQASQMGASQRVDLVAQAERAGDVRRQIDDAFGAEARTDHGSHAVAIGEREKSIPIDAAIAQRGERRRRARLRAASQQQAALGVGDAGSRSIHLIVAGRHGAIGRLS